MNIYSYINIYKSINKRRPRRLNVIVMTIMMLMIQNMVVEEMWMAVMK